VKVSIITITILFIVMAATAYAQVDFPRPPQPRGDSGFATTKGVKIGKLYFKAVVRDGLYGPGETAPATKKRPKAGKLETTNGVMSSDQCRVRDGGCIRPTFPPKKPKIPTRTAYLAAAESGPTAMAFQNGDSGAKKKKETKKDSKPKTDKLNIPIFE